MFKNSNYGNNGSEVLASPPNTAKNGLLPGSKQNLRNEVTQKLCQSRQNLQKKSTEEAESSSGRTVRFQTRQLGSSAMREAMQELSRDGVNLENMYNSMISYPQIDVVTTVPKVYWRKMWAACVAYGCVAMARNGDPSIMYDQQIGGQDIGLYYLGSLGLLYNMYLAFRGEIPVLQRISPTLIDLFHAVGPVIKDGMAWSPTIDVDFETLLSTLSVTYESPINPLASLAPILPEVGGTVPLETAVPLLTVEDVRRFGTDALEKLQQFVLGDVDLENVLQSYTIEGRYSDSIAAFVTANTGITPIQGVLQVYLESNFSMKEHWIAALGFCIPVDLEANLTDDTRQGWVARTLQLGTHLFMLRVLEDGYVIGRKKVNDKFVSKALLHPVDIGTSLATELTQMVAAQYEFEEVKPNDILSGAVQFPNGFLPSVSARQFALSHLGNMSRRFAISCAISAGSYMYKRYILLLGAGSRFVTPIGPYDTSLTSISFSEDLAALTMYFDNVKNLYNIPLLTTYGLCLDPRFGSDDLSRIIDTAYPWICKYNPTDCPCPVEFVYPDFGEPCEPYVGRPDEICFLGPEGVEDVSFTFGTESREAAVVVSNIWGQLQGNVAVSNFQDGSDGPDRRHLNLGISFNAEFRDFIPELNVVPFLLAERLWTTEPAARSLVTNYLTALVPSWIIQSEDQPAFQAIYKLVCSTAVDETYLDYRVSKIISVAHPIATNIYGGSDLSASVAHRVVCGEGGGFFNQILKKGEWVNVAEEILGGLASRIGPKTSKTVKSIVRSLGGKISNMYKNPRGVPIELRVPFEHSLMTPDTFKRLTSS